MKNGITDSHLEKDTFLKMGFNQLSVGGYWFKWPNVLELRQHIQQILLAGFQEVQLHPIIYLIPGCESKSWLPDFQATHEQRLQRVHEVKTHLAAEVSVVDPFNEPLQTLEKYPEYVTMAQVIEIFQAAQSDSWDRRLNTHGILTGDWLDQYIEFIQANEGLFECIGIQAHVFAEESMLPSSTTMLKRLDKLAEATDLPFELSENSCPSGIFNFTQERQAQWIYDFYMGVVKKHPRFRAYNYWDFRDQEAAEFNPTSGIKGKKAQKALENAMWGKDYPEEDDGFMSWFKQIFDIGDLW